MLFLISKFLAILPARCFSSSAMTGGGAQLAEPALGLVRFCQQQRLVSLLCIAAAHLHPHYPGLLHSVAVFVDVVVLELAALFHAEAILQQFCGCTFVGAGYVLKRVRSCLRVVCVRASAFPEKSQLVVDDAGEVHLRQWGVASSSVFLVRSFLCATVSIAERVCMPLAQRVGLPVYAESIVRP